MQDFAYQQRRVTPKPGKLRRVIFLVLLFCVVGWFFLQAIHLVGSLGASVTSFKLFKPSEQAAPLSEGLSSIVANDLPNSSGRYGVFVKNVATGESYGFHEHEVFDSASLYKLWVMGTTYEALEKHTLSMDEMLHEDVEVLNDKFQIASESAELTEGTIEQTVAESLEKMITVSDNYSALLLAWKLRLSNIADYLDRHGLSESKVGTDGSSPHTTASDIGLFLEKLYKGELASSSATDGMLTLLKRQSLNEKLPKLLPEHTVIAHKTGELGTVSHDAGIIYSEKGDYIIVILSDTSAPQKAVERIQKISRDIYDYFQK